MKQNLDLILFTFLRPYLILVSSFFGLSNSPIWFLIPTIFIVKFLIDEIKTGGFASEKPAPEKLIEFNATEKAFLQNTKEQIKIFLQHNWPKIILLIMAITIAGGAFYWYEWRPSQMRIECGRLQDSWMPQNLYYDCLHERGIDK